MMWNAVETHDDDAIDEVREVGRSVSAQPQRCALKVTRAPTRPSRRTAQDGTVPSTREIYHAGGCDTTHVRIYIWNISNIAVANGVSSRANVATTRDE